MNFIILSNLSSFGKNSLKFKKTLISTGFVFLAVVVIFPNTGGSLNPLRWLAPVIFVNPSNVLLDFWWVYILSPFFASLTAFLLDYIIKL